jgi:DNA helicase-2/ATP-dependent DNA helicase PcrA
MPLPPASTARAVPEEVAALLDGCNPEQREAITTTQHPLRILAGAGSGKTRVLTRRIAHRVVTDDVDPRHVLALTFTRKAAGELNNRLRALGLRDAVAAGTFHSIAYAQLRLRWADRNIAPPALLDRKLGFLRRLLPPGADHTTALDLASEIEWAKARAIGPERYERAAAAAGRTTSLKPARVASLFERYEEDKKRRRMVDFDDLLSLCRRAISTDPEFAATQRWRFRHLFVDEFQDVNPLQFSLLTAWLGERDDLCVVGDPNQAIYAWNGADADYLVSFAKHFAGAHTVELRHNYRSSPEILGAAAAALGPGRLAGHRLVAARPSGPAPRLRSYRTDKEEAIGVARAVRDARAPGRSWSAQAVLVRTNAQIPLLEEALRTAGIPCRTRGGGLFALPEIKTALAGLERSSASLAVALADLEAASAPTDDQPAAEADRRANVAALVRLGHDLLALDPTATASAFADWARAGASTDQVGPSGDAVEILTFHAAKGLEWPVVHLAGVEDGFVPIGHAKRDVEVAEEHRLFYVACTRAEQDLRISWAEQRTFGSRTMNRNRSPWLDDVELVNASPALLAARAAAARAGSTPRRGAGARPSAGGRRGAKGAPDDPLLGALKQWRASVAKGANVPAYVVFADATLEAVAARRPRTRGDLASLSGIGPVKLERYGDALLRVVREHDEGAVS